MNKNFRYDVNGLRAYAVVGVVLFHFFPELLPGGFSGVDVFFVISGFLMTKILWRKEDNFQAISNFYLSRFLRIAPALLFLVIVLLILGWFAFTPINYSLLSLHSFQSLLFISNFGYFEEAGYFDVDSKLKWLLHTWSLSLEWQFYIIYPFVIKSILKLRNYRKLALTGLMLISFIASIWLSEKYPNSSFYLLPTRAWELLAGGLIFLVPPIKNFKLSSIFLETTGFILIFLSFVAINESYNWPSYFATLPVFGTIFLLYANNQTSFLTNNLIAQKIGLYSYSIYLWHWPISVFIRQNNLDKFYYSLIGLTLSVIAGAISYYLIEQSVRKKFHYLLAVIFIAISVFAISIYLLNGVPSRFYKKDEVTQIAPKLSVMRNLVENNISKLSKVTINKSEPNISDSFIKSLLEIKDVWVYFLKATDWQIDKCHGVIKDIPLEKLLEDCATENKEMLVLWGDSHAAALYPGLLKQSKEKIGIAQLTDGNGQPFFDPNKKASTGKTLLEINNKKLEFIKIKKPKFILITMWAAFSGETYIDKQNTVDKLYETFDLIKKASPDSIILFVGPVPYYSDSLTNLYLKYYKENGVILPKYSKYGLVSDEKVKSWDSFLEQSMKSYGVKYISLHNMLCNLEGCITRVGDSVLDLTNIDGNHLTPNASIFFAKKILENK